MKSAGHVAKISASSSGVHLPPSIVQLLGLQARTELIATMLFHEPAEPGLPTHRPIGSMIASLYPVRAWPRLFRASFSVPTGPGGIHRFLAAMQELELYARGLEAEEGVDLGCDLLWPTGEGCSANKKDTSSGFVVPAIFAILEVPLKEFGAEGMEKDLRTSRENWSLHRALRELTQPAMGTFTQQAQALGPFQERLKVVDPEVRIDWLSPLRPLNQMATEFGDALHRNEKRIWLRDGRGDGSLTFSVENWRDLLWPSARESVEDALHDPVGADRAVVVSADSDEKIIVAHFFDLSRTAIATFEVVVPAAGLEHAWWEWILEELKEAGGNLLGTGTSARSHGRWGRISVTAAFQLARNAQSGSDLDVGRVLRCFQNLKGETVRALGVASPAFQKLRQGLMGSSGVGSRRRRVAAHCVGLSDLSRVTRSKVRLDSTMRRVRGWFDFVSTTEPVYEKRFGRNPYGFTAPLDYKKYSLLYNIEELSGSDSRLRLAERIQDRLYSEKPESIVLVGAHRTGKTSILNLVSDLINHSDGDQELKPTGNLVAVRINAAVTPPGELLVAIVAALQELAESETSFIGEAQREAARAAAAVGRAFASVLKRASGSVTIPILPMGLAGELKLELGKSEEGPVGVREKNLETKIEELLQPWESAASGFEASHRAAFLRNSFSALRTAIAVAEGVLEQSERPMRLVVAMDEMSDAATWKGEWAFPAWRYAIESEEFSAIRWLFTSSRPLSKAAGYSPLGNALREYNMEPLRSKEAEAFVRAFEIAPPNGPFWPVDSPLAEKDKLRPTVTFGAQHMIIWVTAKMPYLLQVTCCHLFEQGIRQFVPVITESVVEKIVRQRVLPELTDYFRVQWVELRERHEAVVLELADNEGFLRDHKWGRGEIGRSLSPDLQRALERSGLGNAKGRCLIAPLFLEWLRVGTHGVAD